MSFIRLSDNYVDHPKFLALSDGAFRLWHEGMAFCRKHFTDGVIALAEAQGFRYYRATRVKELAAPYKPDAHPLWETVTAGYQVHDYLFWNFSRAEEQAEKDGATKRMRAMRARRRDEPESYAVTGGVTNAVTGGERSPNVLDRYGSDQSSSLEKSEKPFLVTGRSKRPIFKGRRLVVFEWQLEDCMQVLGPHTDDFDLHGWFDALDAMLMESAVVLPKRDGGQWLQAELLKEVKKRRLPIAGEDTDDGDPWAWQCGKCGEIHEGNKMQNDQRLCLKMKTGSQAG